LEEWFNWLSLSKKKKNDSTELTFIHHFIILHIWKVFFLANLINLIYQFKRCQRSKYWCYYSKSLHGNLFDSQSYQALGTHQSQTSNPKSLVSIIICQRCAQHNYSRALYKVSRSCLLQNTRYSMNQGTYTRPMIWRLKTYIPPQYNTKEFQ
jgi:hypothetical protein